MASKVEKYPRGTRVFKTQFSPFYFFLHVLFPRILFSPSSSQFFNTTDLKTKLSNHPPNVQSFNQPDQLTQHSIIQQTISSLCSSSILRSSRSCLFRSVLPLFFFRSDVFQVQKSSLRDLVFLFETRFFKTRNLCGIILPTHQVRIKSLILKFQIEIEFIKLEILVCKKFSNAS